MGESNEGWSPAAIAYVSALEQKLGDAEKTTADLLDAVVAALVECGPNCIVCAEGIEADDDPCDPDGCAGYALRKLVTRMRKRAGESVRSA